MEFLGSNLQMHPQLQQQLSDGILGFQSSDAVVPQELKLVEPFQSSDARFHSSSSADVDRFQSSDATMNDINQTIKELLCNLSVKH
jgi:hypothetical protein